MVRRLTCSHRRRSYIQVEVNRIESRRLAVAIGVLWQFHHVTAQPAVMTRHTSSRVTALKQCPAFALPCYHCYWHEVRDPLYT